MTPDDRRYLALIAGLLAMAVLVLIAVARLP